MLSTCYNIFGDVMTYKLNKFFLTQKESNPSIQYLSTSYVELTGSKCEINYTFLNNKIVYKYSFYLSTKLDGGNSNDLPLFVHLKLQKSNDNFSSNIVDIPGCQVNLSTDDSEDEFYYISVNPLFIIENFDSKYLRLVGRSYSTLNEAQLHQVPYYDGSSQNNIYYDTSLIVMEL